MRSEEFAGDNPLGKASATVEHYAPSLLCTLARKTARRELAIAAGPLPFTGVDIWNLYEVSWLNPGGKPQVAVGQLEIPCDSPCLVESKSLKLYLNSFNQSRFASTELVAGTVEADLSACLTAPVKVKLVPLSQANWLNTAGRGGVCLDAIELSTDCYQPDPDQLAVTGGAIVTERLYSDLFRSCCPVTGQPDWGSVSIAYRGRPINREGLLKYLISFRGHTGFHEQCVERIFIDIQARCQLEHLTVYARFLRRGGIDINPFRTNTQARPDSGRLIRQ